MYGMDVFYISYDEPQKEDFWKRISERIPQALRVDGVKGFHKAHKTCALMSKTKRFFTIDGDTLPNDHFWQLKIDKKLLKSNFVLSWSSKNALNSLSYGNGGIKNWPKDLLINTKTHEESLDANSTVDFCFSLDYYLLPEELSTSYVTSTPFQAFRAGFREGIKMSLRGGLKIEDKLLDQAFHKHIHISNRERLRIWCTVGSDTENGLWAILGARMGLHYLYVENRDHTFIRDYDGFFNYWQTEVLKTHSAQNLESAINDLEWPLKQKLNIDLTLLSPKDSAFFKSVYINRYRAPQPLRWS